MSLEGLEPSIYRLETDDFIQIKLQAQWAQKDSNLQPLRYKRSALPLRYGLK